MLAHSFFLSECGYKVWVCLWQPNAASVYSCPFTDIGGNIHCFIFKLSNKTIDGNNWRWLKKAGNVFKWMAMDEKTGHCWKWLEMAITGIIRLAMAGNCRKLQNLSQNISKWMEMEENGWKWLVLNECLLWTPAYCPRCFQQSNCAGNWWLHHLSGIGPSVTAQ